MKWIKVVTRIASDDAVRALAKDAGLPYAYAVGCCILVFLSLPQYAKDGKLATIPDVQLEGWAMYEGKRGRFAKAFRAHLCTDDGIVTEWEEINGAAMREWDRTKGIRKKTSRGNLDASRGDSSEVLPVESARQSYGEKEGQKESFQDSFLPSSREKKPQTGRAYDPPPVSAFCRWCEGVVVNGCYEHTPDCRTLHVKVAHA